MPCTMTMNSKKIVGILQIGYLPWLGFFDQLARSDLFVIYDDVQFDKGGWRNRNRIKTPNGPQWLTVPVLLKGKAFPLVKDTLINNNQKWNIKHIKSIQQHYGKAPFFDDFAPELFDVLQKRWKWLMDLNMELLNLFVRFLSIDRPIVLSSQLQIGGDKEERLIKIIKRFNGNVFYEGASGRNYIDVEKFKANGITVIFQDYNHPVYRQLYGPFLSHLSIIDLLFNEGPRSLEIITSGSSSIF